MSRVRAPRPSGLPIDAALDDLDAALLGNAVVALEAPPGAGKTTIVPLAVAERDWLGAGRIVMLEPRRMAARAAARRMANLLGEDVGGAVGYRTRLDTRVSDATRIEVVTEGVLTRLIQHDPMLERYAVVIFDEFHERSLHADAGLALALHTQALVRPELRLLIMSATLDASGLAQRLGPLPIVTCAGRQFPVETRYVPPPRDVAMESAAASLVREILQTERGDILVFLPGTPEIRRVAGRLADVALPGHVDVLPLHGLLGAEEQDRVLRPDPRNRRRVVLATSIAETSLTIEGVRIVVDSGLARRPRFSPRTGMTRLETVRVSRSAADQRRGRAGRTGPGLCYRLWHETETAQLVPSAPPEILEADLAPLALDLAVAAVNEPLDLTWLDPPPPAAYAQARELLVQLEALGADGRVTAHGREIARLGMHPRLAHMVLRAAREGDGAIACDIAAILSERDVLRGPTGAPGVDLRLRLDALRDSASVLRDLDRATLHRIRSQAAQCLRSIHETRHPSFVTRHSTSSNDSGRILALAYPDRVAQRRQSPQPRFVLRNGTGAILPPDDALAPEAFIVVAESDGGRPESRVFLAAALSPDDIERDFAGQIREVDLVEWSDDTGVVTHRQRRLDAIVLSQHRVRDPDPGAVAATLATEVRRRGLDMLPWSEAAQRLRARLGFLHHHDASWPDVSDQALLDTLLPPLLPQLSAVRSASDLRRIDVAEALLELLSREQRSRLAQVAPTHFTAPSGSRIPIAYDDPASPSAAVRLQEMFGATRGPSVFAGRVPLTLQLLSPSQRPVQVTRDLGSFWQNSYFEVRKDLRARYPKHHWPDDPLTAAPTSRARGRRRQ
jgi:ATP-dependent helicase HrpB